MEEAILDVLLKAKYASKRLTPFEISKQAGLYRRKTKVDVIDDYGNTVAIMHDAVVSGILGKLNADGKVQLFKDGWELTQDEFHLRSDDVDETYDLGKRSSQKILLSRQSGSIEPSNRRKTRYEQKPISSPIFEIHSWRRNIRAEARYTNDSKFKILKKSEIYGTFTGSGTYGSLHEKILADKRIVLFEPAESLKGVFTQDVTLPGPSAAASVVLGRQSNSKEWIVKGTFITLDEWIKDEKALILHLAEILLAREYRYEELDQLCYGGSVDEDDKATEERFRWRREADEILESIKSDKALIEEHNLTSEVMAVKENLDPEATANLIDLRNSGFDV